MRPKRRILLIDSDENRMSIRRYLFITRGFAVFSAPSADEARHLIASCYPDLVVATWPLAGADLGKLLSEIHDDSPTSHLLLLAERLTEVPDGVFVDAALLKSACSATDIIERAKLLCVRKRGPQKTAQSVDHMMVLAEQKLA